MLLESSGAGELRGRELRPRGAGYWDLFPMPFVPMGSRGGSPGSKANVPGAARGSGQMSF